VFFVIVLALVAFSLQAQAISLKEAEEMALKNYPSLKALELQAKSYDFKAESAKRERFGTLSAAVSYSHYNRNRTLYPLSGLPTPFNPPPFDSQKLSYGFTFTVPLYLGGSVPKRVKLYEIKGKLLQNLKEWKGWELRFNVDSLYLSYLAVSAQLKALESYKKSLERLRETTALGVKKGKFAQVDLLKVESSIGEVEAKTAQLRSQLLYLREALSTFVGRPVLKVEPVPVRYSPVSPNLKELYSELLKRNHLLKSKKGQLQASSQEVKLVKSKYGPRLLVEGSYLRNYGFDSGKNEGIGEVSVKLSVPIFEFGRKKLELLSARLKKLSTLQDYRSAQLSLKRELAEAVSRLSSLQGQIAGYEKELRYSKEVARIELLKYLSGKGDMNHLLLARSKYYLTKAELDSTYYKWLIAKKEIETLLEVNGGLQE